MAHVLKGFHSFTCTPTRSSAIGMSHRPTCLCLPSYNWGGGWSCKAVTPPPIRPCTRDMASSCNVLMCNSHALLSRTTPRADSTDCRLQSHISQLLTNRRGAACTACSRRWLSLHYTSIWPLIELTRSLNKSDTWTLYNQDSKFGWTRLSWMESRPKIFQRPAHGLLDTARDPFDKSSLNIFQLVNWCNDRIGNNDLM